MADRAIEVDQQTADGRRHERRLERPGERSCHRERTRIVAAVRIEERPISPKQRPIGRGDPIAAMFTGDEESVDRRDPSPLQLWQLAKHLPRAFAPFTTEPGEIGISLDQAAPHRDFEAVSL